jgi:hypothetical protein
MSEIAAVDQLKPIVFSSPTHAATAAFVARDLIGSGSSTCSKSMLPNRSSMQQVQPLQQALSSQSHTLLTVHRIQLKHALW